MLNYCSNTHPKLFSVCLDINAAFKQSLAKVNINKTIQHHDITMNKDWHGISNTFHVLTLHSKMPQQYGCIKMHHMHYAIYMIIFVLLLVKFKQEGKQHCIKLAQFIKL